MKTLLICLTFCVLSAYAENHQALGDGKTDHDARPQATPLRVSDRIVQMRQTIARAQPIDCGNARAIDDARADAVSNGIRRLSPLPQRRLDGLRQTANQLIQLLGSPRYDQREQAQRDLHAMGTELLQLGLPRLYGNPEIDRRYNQVYLQLSAQFAPAYLFPSAIVESFFRNYAPYQEAAANLRQGMIRIAPDIQNHLRYQELRGIMKDMAPDHPDFPALNAELAALQQRIGPRPGIEGLPEYAQMNRLLQQSFGNHVPLSPDLQAPSVEIFIKHLATSSLASLYVLGGQPAIPAHRPVYLCQTDAENWQTTLEINPPVRELIDFRER